MGAHVKAAQTVPRGLKSQQWDSMSCGVYHMPILVALTELARGYQYPCEMRSTCAACGLIMDRATKPERFDQKQCEATTTHRPKHFDQIKPWSTSCAQKPSWEWYIFALV